jgi:hypothetical protein
LKRLKKDVTKQLKKPKKNVTKLPEMNNTVAILQPVKVAKCVKRRSRLVLRAVQRMTIIREFQVVITLTFNATADAV